MRNKRKIIKLSSLICILLFLLIPLMSSPVAASFNYGLGNVWTVNWPPPPGAGPTAGGTITGPFGGTLFDTSPFNAQFNVLYNYTDAYPAGSGGMGSNHWMSITVSYQPGGTGPWVGPLTFTQTTIVLGPMGTASGTFTTPMIPANGLSYGGKSTNFQVTVVVNCQDIATTSTFTWTSSTISFTVV